MAKILRVLTGASYWTLKDGHRHPTGYWAEEFVAPYGVFTAAGHEITVATPRGVVPVVDTMSLEPRMAGGAENALRQEAVIESADELRHPISLEAVRLEDFAAVETGSSQDRTPLPRARRRHVIDPVTWPPS